MSKRLWFVTLLSLMLLIGMAGLAWPVHATGARFWPRFDALAVGVPLEDLEGDANTGVFHQFLTNPQGVMVQGNRYWDVGNHPTAGVEFGYAFASGDFNGDGYGDLVVSAPYYERGKWNLYLGWPLRYQFTFSYGGGSGAYGYALAAGDFNGDGIDDLAVGAPLRKLSSCNNCSAGAVSVHYGHPRTPLNYQITLIHEDAPGVPGRAEDGDAFGQTLAAGDFNGDGFDDLAIGMPGEDLYDEEDAGAMDVLYGSPSGLSTVHAQRFFQGSTGMMGGTIEAGDRFAYVLAAGDFDGDGYDDLVVGVPAEDVGAVEDAGAIHVIYGSAQGLNPNRKALWVQEDIGLESAAFDNFGWSLVAGDFTGRGRDSLIVGIRGEDVADVTNAGAIAVIQSTPQGLSTQGAYRLHQDSPGIIGYNEMDDRFGYSLAAGDLNGDGYEDLVIGSPFEDYTPPGETTPAIDAGVVDILFGGRLGFTHSQRIGQDIPEAIDGMAEAGDHFGFRVAVIPAPSIHLPFQLRYATTR